MVLPETGPLAASDIIAEFGLGTPMAMSALYSIADGVPSSGAVQMSNMRGKVRPVPADGVVFTLDARSIAAADGAIVGAWTGVGATYTAPSNYYSVPTTGPLYRAGAGRPCVEFTANNQLALSSHSVACAAGGGMTFVVLLADPAGSGSLWNGSSTLSILLDGPALTAYVAQYLRTVSVSTPALAATGRSACVFRVSHATQTAQWFVNGIAASSAPFQNSSSVVKTFDDFVVSEARLGSYPGIASYIQGKLEFVALYARALGDSEIANISAWLLSRS